MPRRGPGRAGAHARGEDPGAASTRRPPAAAARASTAGAAGRAGDLYVVLAVAAHERFERDGSNVLAEVEIGYAQAVLGAAIEVETLHGTAAAGDPGRHPARRAVPAAGKGIARLGGSRPRRPRRARAAIRVPAPGRRRRRAARPAAQARRARRASRCASGAGVRQGEATCSADRPATLRKRGLRVEAEAGEERARSAWLWSRQSRTLGDRAARRAAGSWRWLVAYFSADGERALPVGVRSGAGSARRGPLVPDRLAGRSGALRPQPIDRRTAPPASIRGSSTRRASSRRRRAGTSAPPGAHRLRRRQPRVDPARPRSSLERLAARRQARPRRRLPAPASSPRPRSPRRRARRRLRPRSRRGAARRPVRPPQRPGGRLLRRAVGALAPPASSTPDAGQRRGPDRVLPEEIRGELAAPLAPARAPGRAGRSRGPRERGSSALARSRRSGLRREWTIAGEGGVARCPLRRLAR